MTQYATTPRHFRVFVREAKAAIRRLGGTDYSVAYDHADTECPSTYATAEADRRSMAATITFATSWPEVPTLKSIRDTARHEAVHILLAKFSELARDRYATESEMDQAEEELVRQIGALLRWEV